MDAFCRAASLAELLADALSWTLSAAPAITCTSVRGRCFSSTTSTVSTAPQTRCAKPGFIPFDGYSYLLSRRFEEAIDVFLKAQAAQGPNQSVSSALAEAYHRLAFQTLADQVRRSVRSVPAPVDVPHRPPPIEPLRVRPELLARAADDAAVSDPEGSHAYAWISRIARGAILFPRHGLP